MAFTEVTASHTDDIASLCLYLQNRTVLLGVFAGRGPSNTQESKSSHPCGLATRKVRQQAAQNQLDLLDMGAFRRELDDVAKRLEDRCDPADICVSLCLHPQLPTVASEEPVTDVALL